MSTPTDTLFTNQWYLKNASSTELDLNILKVWDEFTGKGIRVAVVDDGFEHTHSDLVANYSTSLDRDFGSGDDDAAPFLTGSGLDNHGTAVMGIIGSARNGTGVVGVAYQSTLIGYRITYDVTADVWSANFVAALERAVDASASVLNMSFGGAGDFDGYQGATNIALEKTAIGTALSEGRDGLGLVLIKSAGNSRSSAIDVNHNQSDNNSGQIIVAAVNRDGFVSSYSSFGAPILVSAFGSPGSGAGEIWTTDRLGTLGYNTSSTDGDFTSSFNGTSAAAPMVTGVVALMLQANDQLGWRDVQTILASTARHVGSEVDGATLAGSEQNPWHWNDATNWNGGGMHYSEDYGYGLVDALAAVRLAEAWDLKSTSANQKNTSLDLLATSTAIPDANLTGLSFARTMSKELVVERVTVTLHFTTSHTEDLDVYLTGPDGREERLITDGNSLSYDDNYSFHTQAFRGETSAGQWSVRVADDTVSNLISVSDIKITVFGANPGKNDTYIYTNEFSDYDGNGHSTTLRDTDGGVDLLNAAAVSSAMFVDLSKGAGRIDGVTMKLSGIDNVYGGDGADTLRGGTGENVLAGGRGADTLTGGKGDDEFVYRVVKDSYGFSVDDTIRDFGTGDDRIDLSDIDTMTRSGDQAFSFIGSRDFRGRVAELHFVTINRSGVSNDFTRIEADLDGDKTVDFRIELSGLHSIVKSDFIL